MTSDGGLMECDECGKRFDVLHWFLSSKLNGLDFGVCHKCMTDGINNLCQSYRDALNSVIEATTEYP